MGKSLLKKPTLDHSNLENYRPVSNLSFLSKVIGKIVLRQLFAFFNSHDLLRLSKSAYYPCHSTETALLIMTDILRALDDSNVSVLILRDLSSAFDSIDHCILSYRLQSLYVISGTVLSWFESSLTGRTQTMTVNDRSSRSADVSFIVPQGSVLVPILFIHYSAHLSSFCLQPIFCRRHTTTSLLSSRSDTRHCPDHADIHL